MRSAAIAVEVRLPRSERNCPVEISERAIQIAGALSRGGAIVISPGVAGVDCDSLIEVIDGGFGGAQIAMDPTTVDVSVKVAWIEFDGLVEIFESAREIALALPGHTAIVPGHRRLRVESNGDVVIGNRAIDFAFLHP